MGRDGEEAGELAQGLCPPALEGIILSWSPGSAPQEAHFRTLRPSLLICEMGGLL